MIEIAGINAVPIHPGNDRFHLITIKIHEKSYIFLLLDAD